MITLGKRLRPTDELEDQNDHDGDFAAKRLKTDCLTKPDHKEGDVGMSAATIQQLIQDQVSLNQPTVPTLQVNLTQKQESLSDQLNNSSQDDEDDSNLQKNLTPAERRQRRLLQNRKSAQKARLKKKEQVTSMATDYEAKAQENAELKEQVLQITQMLYKKIEENQELQQRLNECVSAQQNHLPTLQLLLQLMQSEVGSSQSNNSTIGSESLSASIQEQPQQQPQQSGTHAQLRNLVSLLNRSSTTSKLPILAPTQSVLGGASNSAFKSVLPSTAHVGLNLSSLFNKKGETPNSGKPIMPVFKK